MLLSREGRAYRTDVCARLAALVGRMAGERRPLEGPLRVVVTLHPPDRRKRDADNALKAVCDALQHAGVISDDSQIVDLRVIKAAVARGSCADVQIEELR